MIVTRWAAIVAPLALLVVSIACWLLRTMFARRVLGRRGRRPRLWKAVCFGSTLTATAAVLLAVESLVVLSNAKVVASDGVIAAIAVGVLGNNLDRQANSGFDYYWRAIHDSLRGALTVASPVYPSSDSQTRTFNLNHMRLYEPHERRVALQRILAAEP